MIFGLMLLAVAIIAGLLFIVLSRIRPGGTEGQDAAVLQAKLEALEKSLERTERALLDELARSKELNSSEAKRLRDELHQSLEVGFRKLGDSAEFTSKRLDLVRNTIEERQDKLREEIRTTLSEMRTSNEVKIEGLRGVVDERLKSLQEDNGAKLDLMRQTVDEKLQGTLEKRLGESFQQVSERLEQVHKGLGEMQVLATGVGDLKKVLTNVKTRGNWGEVQLGALLEQMLTPDQFGRNVAVTGSSERVEFALKLPGRDDAGACVWLPIDAKFPQEDYQRLVEAAEAADIAAVETASKALEMRIRECARMIADKYVAPPATTDFGILFLPTEGLYAEVLRRPGLADSLQRDHRVTIAGPTTLCAILNSLQMGFRTLAIQKRSSEVWEVLGKVKTEFGKYGELMKKVEKKLQEASNTVKEVGTRTNVITRALRGVEALPSAVPELGGNTVEDLLMAAQDEEAVSQTETNSMAADL
jgi:DNA recombination protein RmuC